MFKTLFAVPAAVVAFSLVSSLPASAAGPMECTNAAMDSMSADMAGVTDSNVDKSKVQAEMDLASASMKANDMDGCKKHMMNVMKMMGKS